jgi:hypothetical protein
MALKLIANYSKRLGLPGFSSHQFSISVEAEISNVDDVRQESERLYATLQQSVDEQIQQTGFVPDADYGSNGNGYQPVNRIKANGIKTNGLGSGWHCSDKQRELILKLIADHNLEEVAEEMSQEMFGVSPKDLNKLQASGLIQRILEEHASKKPSKGKNGNGRYVNGGVR